MFKKFKDKLAEEMKQSPARLQASMQQLAQVVPGITNVSTSELSTSNDNFSLGEGDDDTPKNTPDKYKLQAVDLTSYSSNSMGLSRTSSVNSVTSTDTSGLFPIYEIPGSTYHIQSDMDQSASEVDEHINPQFDQVTKEQIYAAYRKVQTKYHKYRGRYTDLANHYREMERSKSKLESCLVETQDKALRRIADLKEQCQLEQQAKAHLEEALRNDIEEKDHIIDTLNTKANGSSTLISLQNQDNLMDIVDNKDKNENNSSALLDNISSEQSCIPETINLVQSELIEENQQLKNKLEKLEDLLMKYKEFLKRGKDKISEITQDKMILERDLELTKNHNHEQLQTMTENLNEAKAEIIILKEKINTMKRVEEESAISLAENKLSIHRELEIKEEQIKKLTLELKDAMQGKNSVQIIGDSNSEKSDIAKNFTEEKTDNVQSCADNNMDYHKYLQQEETIKSLNEMMDAYVVELNEAKETIQAQNVEMIQSKRELTENYEKLKVEFEEKLSDFSRLQSELIDCRSTINQLNEKLTDNVTMHRHLVEEKNSLIRHIGNYMKIIQSLKNDCNQLRIEFKNSKINQKQQHFQVTKLIQEKLSDYVNYQSHLIVAPSNEAIESYKLELENKNSEIKNIREKLSDFEGKNNKMIAELDNVNCKIFDIIKERDSAKEYVNEIMKEKDLLNRKLEEIESKYINQLDAIQAMEKEIAAMRQRYAEQEESINQYHSEKQILINNVEKASIFEEDCKKLNAEIAEITMKLNNKISTITSENEIYKNNLAENAIQLKNVNDRYESIVMQYENSMSEINRITLLLQKVEAESQNLISDNSKLSRETSALSIQVQNLTDMLQTKNEFIEKLKLLKVESRKLIQEKNVEIEKLLAEKEKLIDANKELNIRENEYENLMEKLSNLSSNNDELKIELERQREINNNLKSQIDESDNLISVIEDLRNYQEKSEIEKKELKNVENELLKANQELQDDKNLLEKRVIELEELSQFHLNEITDLKKEIENKVIQIEESNDKMNNDSQIEENRLKRIVEELQSQLHEKESTFITFQAAQSQIEIENEKLKIEIEKMREELSTIETEQTLRMQQLVKEFQARLHDKDTEIQAALDQKFDWQKNYESELVQQYREQLKDFQHELTAKSEEIEELKMDKNPDSNKEIEKLVQTIATIKLEHANELTEADVKRRETLKQKCDQLEAKHSIVINELTNEWKKNQFTDDNLAQKPEELENMSAMAMAAVQSNTGSFHSLQQTLVNQRRELVELRKLVKLRSETLDDSTEIEYLRNILYEYMMGRETLVLARVIAAVVKFDQDQTHKILKKEEDKLTLLGSLGLT
ncbi:hypothetical protein PV328_004881 [Microctonus aethiopoides]|uniref:GRIP domain-containing protein n=1 Tax=Microctonus aethiopoides TaxID=144406 RepID=A0AA39FBK2_9HYME|nr:hypothetical protein PV328_004881 [Microctonus aethiopoides]